MEILDQQKINDIRKNADIVEIISDYVSLTPHGKNYFGVCPFHNDNNPSMSVSKEKQIYKCFSCGECGNVFTFVQKYENVSFIEAVKIVASKIGINLDINVKKVNNEDKYQNLYDIYDLSLKLYQNNINTKFGLKAKSYLLSRKIDDEIIKEFNIGLSLRKNTLLTDLLINKGYSYNELLDSGLVNKSQYGYNDIYSDRIMFPLHNLEGKVVGYSGRIYDSQSDSKYINTKETKIFKKGEMLYNYHRAKDSIRQKDEVIIVEGFLDVIRLYTVGIKNVVAMMGTAVTTKQAHLIKRLSKNVILMFDGDGAGEKATESASKELIAIGVTPKVVRLEENLDPDEYILKYGQNKIIGKLENPISITEFKLSYYKKGKNLGVLEEQADYINEVIKSLNEIDDDILREITLNKISEESKIDINLLRKKLEPKKVVPTEPKEVKLPKMNKYEKAQMYLLYYMLNSKEVVNLYAKKVRYIPENEYRLLARFIYQFYQENNYVSEADLISVTNNDILENVLKKIQKLNLKETYTLEEINDFIDTINEFNIKEEIKKLNEDLKKETDFEKQSEILGKIAELNEEIKTSLNSENVS